MNFDPFPKLITERLILRKLEIEDGGNVKLLRSNEIVNKYLFRPKQIDIHEAIEFITEINKKIERNECLHWAICLIDANIFIGTICLWNISTEKNKIEIGFELNSEYHSKGFMQEAVEVVIQYAFSELKFDVVTAFVNEKNQKSIQLFKRNNFRLDANFQYADKEELGKYTCYFLHSTIF